MGREHRLFGEDITDDELRGWHNVPITIRYRDAERPDETVMGWDAVETPTGSLMIRRLVELDDDHPNLFIYRTVAPGAWLDWTSGGATFDLEAIRKQEQEAANAEAAARLGVGGPNGAPPRRG